VLADEVIGRGLHRRRIQRPVHAERARLRERRTRRAVQDQVAIDATAEKRA
jgi:hypothetical protein